MPERIRGLLLEMRVLDTLDQRRAPMAAAVLADEMPHARFVAARRIVEWRARPDRLTFEAIDFVSQCWSASRAETGLG